MKTRWILIPLTCLSMVLCNVSSADAPARGGAPGKSLRLDTVKRPAPRSAVQRVNVARPGGSLHRTGAGSPAPVARDRGYAATRQRGYDRNVPGMGAAPLGGLLEEYLYNEFGGRQVDPWGGEKAHAEAYRDAAIANAIVNVVGILATASQRPTPVAMCPEPSPAAPQGHIERQRVMVQEGRTEEYQVWVPEYVIPATGEVVLGHHETRRREIAPVFEEREIWVPVP